MNFPVQLVDSLASFLVAQAFQFQEIEGDPPGETESAPIKEPFWYPVDLLRLASPYRAA